MQLPLINEGLTKVICNRDLKETRETEAKKENEVSLLSLLESVDVTLSLGHKGLRGNIGRPGRRVMFSDQPDYLYYLLFYLNHIFRANKARKAIRVQKVKLVSLAMLVFLEPPVKKVS